MFGDFCQQSVIIIKDSGPEGHADGSEICCATKKLLESVATSLPLVRSDMPLGHAAAGTEQ